MFQIGLCFLSFAEISTVSNLHKKWIQTAPNFHGGKRWMYRGCQVHLSPPHQKKSATPWIQTSNQLVQTELKSWHL